MPDTQTPRPAERRGPRARFGDRNKKDPHGKDPRGKDRGGKDRGGKKPNPKNENPGLSPAAAEHLLGQVASAVEKPLAAGDHEAQETALMPAIDALRALKPQKLDDLPFSVRGKFFTALLRLGRGAEKTFADLEPVALEGAPEAAAPTQPDTAEIAAPTSVAPIPNPKERGRKHLLAVVSTCWKLLRDDAKAARAMDLGGDPQAASKLWASAGEWQEVAAIHEREGRPLEAAKLFEEKKVWAEARRLYQAAGDNTALLRIALREGDEATVKAAAGAMGDEGVKTLVRENKRKLAFAVLTELGKHADAAQLAEKGRDFIAAAEAWERAGNADKSVEAWKRVRDFENAKRAAEPEVQKRIGHEDLLGAGALLAKAGDHARAAAVAAEKHPDRAHRWLLEGRLDAQALELAQAQSAKCEEKGAWEEAAQWQERAGEQAGAAVNWLRAGKPASALPIFEQLSAWRECAVCCEQLKRLAKAIEYYQRLGDQDAIDRVRDRKMRDETAAAAAKLAAAEAAKPKGA